MEPLIKVSGMSTTHASYYNILRNNEIVSCACLQTSLRDPHLHRAHTQKKYLTGNQLCLSQLETIFREKFFEE